MTKKNGVLLIGLLGILLIAYISWVKFKPKPELSFIYPFNEILFPPEFPSPTFIWSDLNNEAGEWVIQLSAKAAEFTIIDTVTEFRWQPDSASWEKLKLESANKAISVSLQRLSGANNFQKTSIKIFISSDSVGAPILYREVPLPFAFAEKHPDSLSYKLVNVGSYAPPFYSMKRFMVCGNCHSFSDDGKTIGLDFDAALRDKGGYFISAVKDTIVFDTSSYLSWNKLQPDKTFGMFSRVSPNGRYVVTTIKDRVLSWNTGFDPAKIAFSQIFFPVNGVLAIYDRQTKKLWELPGANNPEFVQSNAAWSPDGEYIVFARANAFPSENGEYDIKINDPDIVKSFGERKREFKFDLYVVPFNNGKGGEATALKGASGNGKSNYFPAVSPDGKWIVYCQAENYMLLNPDSRMYIVPFNGGKARKMRSNLYSLNSWHAWSPNGKWIVFSSKGLSVFTDLFLTHIDEKGNSTPPVLIERSRKPNRAVNYPEFINVDPNYKFTMLYNYVNLDHITRAMLAKDTAQAKILYDEFIAQGQYSLPDEFVFLARFNKDTKQYAKALEFLEMALKKDPGNSAAAALKYEVLRLMR